jgi:hypothetical protein
VDNCSCNYCSNNSSNIPAVAGAIVETTAAALFNSGDRNLTGRTKEVEMAGSISRNLSATAEELADAI